MHASVSAFIQSAVEALELRGPVYEFAHVAVPSGDGKACVPQHFIDVGHLDGSVRGGAEIDRMEELGCLPYADGAAGTVACINVLEQAYEPQRAAEELLRILAPGGILLLCTSSAPEAADWSDPYWRLTPRSVQRMFAPLEVLLTGWQGPDWSPHTVFGVGCSTPVPDTFVKGIQRMLDRFQTFIDGAAGRCRRAARLKRLLFGWTRSKGEWQRGRDCHEAKFVLHMPIDSQFQHQLLQGCLPAGTDGMRTKMR
jgi:SAM-dependent methyltransferase